jgi:hypothetical protein
VEERAVTAFRNYFEELFPEQVGSAPNDVFSTIMLIIHWLAMKLHDILLSRSCSMMENVMTPSKYGGGDMSKGCFQTSTKWLVFSGEHPQLVLLARDYFPRRALFGMCFEIALIL